MGRFRRGPARAASGAAPLAQLLAAWSLGGVVGRPAFVASTEGGMDIEEVAHETPEKILTLPIDPTTGVTDADAAMA